MPEIPDEVLDEVERALSARVTQEGIEALNEIGEQMEEIGEDPVAMRALERLLAWYSDRDFALARLRAAREKK